MSDWLCEIGPGWYELVRPLIDRCAAEDITIYRVKQKFGSLRFQADTGTSGKASDALREAILDAEARSVTLCEQCGDPGRLRNGPRICTLCDHHEVQRLLSIIKRIELMASACDGNYEWAVNQIGGIAADVISGVISTETQLDRAAFPKNRHDPATWVLYLLADEHISVGKACEWLADYIRTGQQGPLPDIKALPMNEPSNQQLAQYLQDFLERYPVICEQFRIGDQLDGDIDNVRDAAARLAKDVDDL
jgi:hypothetical protein